MNNQLIWRRLWQKEIRQQYPLLLLLLLILSLGGLGFLVHNLAVGHRFSQFSVITVGHFLLGIPCLFAIGISGLLIGQEKETRTLEWLSALPISSQQIVSSKLWSSLLTLGLLWIPCGLATWIYFSHYPQQSSDWLLGLTFFCYSWFFLVTGLAIQWRLESPFYGLLVLGLSGLIPLGIAEGLALMYPSSFGNADVMSGFLLCGTLVVLTFISLYFCFRLGVAALSPKSVSAETQTDSFLNHQGTAKIFSWDTYRSSSAAAGYGKRYSPAAVLLWQFVRQNQKLLLIFSALLVVATSGFVLNVLSIYPQVGLIQQFPNELLSGYAGYGMVLSHLVYCWLGVLAFHGDSNRGRVRFFADRGVMPISVWFSRHAVPLMMILLFAGLTAAVTIYFSHGQFQSSTGAVIVSIIFGLILLAHGLVCYGFGQWVGQICRSSILAAILAPVIGLLAIGSCLFFLHNLNLPWWMMLMIVGLPYLATACQTKHWMDQVLGRRFWLLHATALATMLILPTLFFTMTVLREPTISPQADQEMRAMASTVWPERPFRHVMVHQPLSHYISLEIETGGTAQPELASDLTSQPTRYRIQSEDRHQKMVEWIDQSVLYTQEEIQELGLTHLERSIQQTKGVDFSLSPNAYMFLASLAITTRESWALSSPSESSIAIYRRAVSLLLEVVGRLRGSLSLDDQRILDRIELVLWLELECEAAEDNLGHPLYESLIQQLGDQASRQQARLQAIAVNYLYLTETGSWYPPSPHMYFIGYRSSGTRSLFYQRRIKRAVEDLWNFAQHPDSANDPQLIADISRNWGWRFGADYTTSQQIPYGDQWESLSDQEKKRRYRAIAFEFIQVEPDCLLWHAPWEQEAAERLQQLNQISESS